MFFKKAHTPEYNEFAAELEKNLQQVEQAPLVEKQAKQERAVQHLLKAAEILEDMGLDKQASGITQILERFAWEVPKSDSATSGLTPEKMVSNLEHSGWVFNAKDGDVIDVAEPEPGETVEMKPDGELEVTDDSAANDGVANDGMAANPMNPVNPGPMASLAAADRIGPYRREDPNWMPKPKHDMIEISEFPEGSEVIMSLDGTDQKVTVDSHLSDYTSVVQTEDGRLVQIPSQALVKDILKLAAVKNWPEGTTDPYGEEQVDLDIRHLLKKK